MYYIGKKMESDVAIKEGEWLISVVTELPFNEVFKIVENINYCN